MGLNTTGIDHPAIAVKDIHEMVKWYCDVLNYEVECQMDPPVYLLKAADGSFIEVMPIDETQRPERTTWTPGWSHLALRVENMDAAIEYLDTHNVKWLSEVVPPVGGGKLRSFEDPEGNMWQIVER